MESPPLYILVLLGLSGSSKSPTSSSARLQGFAWDVHPFQVKSLKIIDPPVDSAISVVRLRDASGVSVQALSGSCADVAMDFSHSYFRDSKERICAADSGR